MMRFFALMILPLMLFGGIYSTDITPLGVKKEYMGIELLDQKKINLQQIGQHQFREISDLAYNKSKNLLYMVSDEGVVFTFNAQFETKIEKLAPLKAFKLLKANGKNFRSYRHDSEGATLDSRNRLIISFEGRPKVARFDTNGRLIHRYKLPYKISKIRFLRHKNKGIEALAYHKHHGLIMATEYPIKKDNKKIQTIYSSDGYEWKFKASSAQNSAVTAIEVMDDGTVLVLERAFSGLFSPLVITLKKVYINKKCHKKRLCKDKVLAIMDNSKGWSVDNFEGLAKVDTNRYIMISDDGDNFYQDTVLLYFKIK